MGGIHGWKSWVEFMRGIHGGGGGGEGNSWEEIHGGEFMGGWGLMGENSWGGGGNSWGGRGIMGGIHGKNSWVEFMGGGIHGRNCVLIKRLWLRGDQTARTRKSRVGRGTWPSEACCVGAYEREGTSKRAFKGIEAIRGN